MVTTTDLTDCLNRSPVAGEEVHEADGQESGAASGFFDAVEGVVDGQPGDVDAFGFQTPPGVKVGGELFSETDHAVAGLPIETRGDGGDALRGVLHKGDFGGLGVDEAGGGSAKDGVDIEPFAVVETAVLEGIVGEVFHGIDADAREGGDGGMVEVDEVVPDGKLVCVLAP
jgi:hypothetical protein